MKITLIFVLLATVLLAKEKDSCYTVQLLSDSYSVKSFESLSNREFPASCRVMHISTSLTVRCGCFEGSKEAKKLLLTFQKDYAKAYVATTYKYRFKKNKSLITPLVSAPQEPVNIDESELKSYFEQFISEKEYEYAKEIAILGYKLKPNSIYWNQKLLALTLYFKESENSKKYTDFLYKEKYKKLFLVLKHSDKEQRAIVKQESLNVEFMSEQNRVDYFSTFLSLSLLYENEEYASELQSMLKKDIKYHYEDAKLLAYFYFKNYDIDMAYKALLFANTQNADKKYYEILSDLSSLTLER